MYSLRCWCVAVGDRDIIAFRYVICDSFVVCSGVMNWVDVIIYQKFLLG